MSNIKNLLGKAFGRLTVIEERESNKNQKKQWLCQCICGNKIITVSNQLISGKTQSCGCKTRDTCRELGLISNLRHGHNKKLIKSPTWYSWHSMKDRCTYPSHVSYKSYGGRGIVVCEKWKTFECFLEDMGERPEGKTLDRKDVNGNYEPNNCRWATPTEQQANRR